MAAFDYHLPPAQLSPRETRSVHPDAAELSTWGLRHDAHGWTMVDSLGEGLAGIQRRRNKPRGAIWPERMSEAGLA